MGKRLKAIPAEDFFEALREEDEAFCEAEKQLRHRLLLGMRMQQLRAARRMTQAQLAEAAGTTQARIANIEGGSANPQLSTLERIADALEAEIADLFAPEDPPPARVDLPKVTTVKEAVAEAHVFSPPEFERLFSAHGAWHRQVSIGEVLITGTVVSSLTHMAHDA